MQMNMPAVFAPMGSKSSAPGLYPLSKANARMRAVIPFSSASRLARAADVHPIMLGRPGMVNGLVGVPKGMKMGTIPGGLKLGNLPQELSDYINSPGTPGSSSFMLYGLGQDDGLPTDGASASVDPTTDVTTSSSPSFWASLQSMFTTATDAAKVIVPAVLQQQRAIQASKDLSAGKITQAQYNQMIANPTATFALTPSAGLATGLKIGGGTLAILGVGALMYLFISRRGKRK